VTAGSREDGAGQLRHSAIVEIGIRIIEILHHAILVALRDFGSQKNVGKRGRRRGPDGFLHIGDPLQQRVDYRRRA